MSDLAGLSILLLEDEYLIALDAEQSLKEFGAERVEIASTLREAERLAATGRFDVALLDVNINGEMSFALAESLRQRGIPVVFATGYELKSRDAPPIEVGVIISKPYTKERLRDALSGALSSSRSSSAASAEHQRP
jgi:CheY-like chemotaxis protein